MLLLYSAVSAYFCAVVVLVSGVDIQGAYGAYASPVRKIINA